MNNFTVCKNIEGLNFRVPWKSPTQIFPTRPSPTTNLKPLSVKSGVGENRVGETRVDHFHGTRIKIYEFR